MTHELAIREQVSLASLTTLGVGGPARYFAEPSSLDDVRAALAWADARSLQLQIIGGGSNLLVADRGVDALVLRSRASEIRALDRETVEVDAGVSWDSFVDWAVGRDLAGVECLSGIPGDVGAAPIQNIGAYGQELSEALLEVDAIDRTTGGNVTLSHADCELAYRDSMFKRRADSRYVLTRVRFRLRPGGTPKIAYAELERAMSELPTSLAHVRSAVIRLRRAKSMVLDPTDENRQSAGSFFVNPTIAADDLQTVKTRAHELAPNEPMPAYPAPDARIKLSAAWLIERAGLPKGTTRGRVGISTKHSLGIINKGGASASELIDFALEVKHRVRNAFGVTLQPEPRMVGFTFDEIAPLLQA